MKNSWYWQMVFLAPGRNLSMRALSAAVYLLEDLGNLVGFHY